VSVSTENQARAKARLRRGMYLLPSLFTMGNIAGGFFSLTETFRSVTDGAAASFHLNLAALAIIIAIPFDSLDGRIARMTNTCSEFGKELDSLADAVTFGVAPALLALVWGFHFLPPSMDAELRKHLVEIGSLVCFLFLIGGVSRLARFNISHDAQPRNPGRPDRKYFVGMPIPAAAGLIAATVHFFDGYPVQVWWVSAIWTALVGMAGFLMVSTWRFWSGKEINFSRRHPSQLMVLMAVVLYVMVRYSRNALFSLALIYMCSGIWARAAYSWQRRRRQKPGAPERLNLAEDAPREPGQ